MPIDLWSSEGGDEKVGEDEVGEEQATSDPSEEGEVDEVKE
jgi:hypothetical protein